MPADRIIVPAREPIRAPAAHGSNDGIVRLLAVGAVVPRKGFDVLVAALATLLDLPWRLTIAGDRGRDAEAAAQLDADIARFKLGDRIAVLGAVSPERLAELYAGADLFALASRFEGYGMAFSEAIAHGLPVVGTTAGAIPRDSAAGSRAARRPRRRGRARGRVAPGNRRSGRNAAAWRRRRARRRKRFRAGRTLRNCSRARSRPPHDRLFGRLARIARAARRCARAIRGSRCGRGFIGRQYARFGSSISPAAPARQCARWRRDFPPGRTGGSSTTISVCWRARPACARPAGVTLTTVPIDLNHDLEAALDGPIDLVTTSALLDLVSEAWLDRLAVETLARSIPVYAALSYDGRIEISPSNPLDAAIVAAVNAHQRGDKGFGPALGPAAAGAAIARFESLGCAVVHGKADWVVGPHDREFQMEILAGWASAARELGDLSLGDIVGWLTWRRDAVAAGRSSIRVGHVDIFARPTGTR